MSISAVAPAVIILSIATSFRRIDCVNKIAIRKRTQVTFKLQIHYGQVIIREYLSYKFGFLFRARVISRSRIGQSIADAELSQQDLGPIWINLDFLAQLAHEDSQVLRIVDVRLPPHRLKQVLVRYDFSRVLGEHLEQTIFFRRKIKAFTVQLHRSGCKVDDEAIQPQRTFTVLALA